MRHPSIPLNQEWRQRVIRRLIREVVERADVVQDIHDSLRSLLDHADQLLSRTRRDYIEISTKPLERDRSRRRIEVFRESTDEILASLKKSIRMLGGEDAPLLMRQALETEGLIQRVTDLCILLLSEAAGVLNE